MTQPSKSLLACLLTLAVAGLAAPTSGASPEPSAFLVVAFADRITSADRTALEATGASVLDYEPPDSYVVWATPAQREAASGLPSVTSVRPLDAARKLAQSLAGRTGRAKVEVLVAAPVLPAALGELSRLGAIGDVHPARRDAEVWSVVLTLDSRALHGLAGRSWVLHVEPVSAGMHLEDERTNQIQAGGLDSPQGLRPGYRDWLDSVGLDGSGVRVAVVDTGIDMLHPDLAGKVPEVVNYGVPGTGPVAGTVDAIGHGTHVAGIIAGRGLRVGDTTGFSYGMGVAPGAELVDLNALGLLSSSSVRSSMARISGDAASRGARMWNASWHTGQGERVGYTSNTRLVDELSRTAATDTGEFLYVFSAGNAGQRGPTVPKEAKNLIAVGSSNSGRGSFADPALNVGGAASDPDGVSGFSSRGPALDGRVFPTVTAPGGRVVSARGAGGAYVSALCGGQDSAPLYVSCSGTSMAAPHASGAAALLHEWWQREHGTVPSPAMVRALLVAGARDMGEPDVPNNDEGWGRIDLSQTISDEPRLLVDQTHVFTDPGQSVTYTVTPADPSTPMKVTLAWSDAPGSVGADPALVNDLDLVVERLDAQGDVVAAWLGNVFSDGRSVAGGERDRLNNLENVFLHDPGSWTYRVTIRAHNVPGDGIPANPDPTDQDFALVVRNALV